MRATLRAIVPGHPITYAIEDSYNPSVRSAPNSITYKDHLDSVALQANVGYEYHSGTLIITPTMTKRYTVPLSGGGTNNIIVSNNNLSETSTQGTFSNNLYSSITPRDDVLHLVHAALDIPHCTGEATDKEPQATTDRYTANTNECYSIAPSGNLLTITARPHRIVKFDAVYEEWIKAVTRQAIIKFTTIRLDVTELAQQHIDISTIRNATIAGSLENITSNLVDSTVDASGSVMTIRIDDPGSPWNTSQIILRALNRIGNASIEDSREMVVYNNRLVTFRDFSVTRYIEQISIESTNTGGTSRETPNVEVGNLETGQALNILPTLTDDLIGMHIVINEAILDGFTQYELFGTSGVLPQNSGSDTIFDVTLNDSEAVLLASTSRIETNHNVDQSGLLPVWPFNLIGPNASEGRRRVIQTLYLIEGEIKHD